MMRASYKLTPRDLFNPPPQALWPVKITQNEIDLLREMKYDYFPDCEHPMAVITSTIIDLLEELARRTGSVK